jgi:hypothetical protein
MFMLHCDLPELFYMGHDPPVKDTLVYITSSSFEVKTISVYENL